MFIIHVGLPVKYRYRHIWEWHYLSVAKAPGSWGMRPTAASVNVDVHWQCRANGHFTCKAIYVYITNMTAGAINLRKFFTVVFPPIGPICITHGRDVEPHLLKGKGPVPAKYGKLTSLMWVATSHSSRVTSKLIDKRQWYSRKRASRPIGKKR